MSLEFEQGMTILSAKGFYSGTDRNVIYIVLNRFEISKMKILLITLTLPLISPSAMW